MRGCQVGCVVSFIPYFSQFVMSSVQQRDYKLLCGLSETEFMQANGSFQRSTHAPYEGRFCQTGRGQNHDQGRRNDVKARGAD